MNGDEQQAPDRTLRRGLHTSVVDNSTAFGYSIMITASFAALSSLRGSPALAEVFGFALGAAVTFPLFQGLATAWFRRRPDTSPREVVIKGTALNFLSVGLAVGAATLVGVILEVGISWPIAGLLASSTYLLAESAELAGAERIERRRGDRGDDQGPG